MKIVWILLVTCACALTFSVAEDEPNDDSMASQWQWFKTLYNRKFKSKAEELRARFRFITRMAMIRKHNKLFKLGKVTYQTGINSFSDMDHSDFVRQYNGFRSEFADPQLGRTANIDLIKASGEPPKSVDWRERGIITPIQHQYGCMSCWTFASTAAIEAYEKLKNNRTVGLSEQNLLDCARSNNNAGCQGGHMVYAFNWVKNHSGINYRYYYPYEVAKGQCRHQDKYNGARTKGFVRVTEKDEDLLKHLVAKIGPIAVGIDGDDKELQNYKLGVYYSTTCSSTKLSHAVLVVGYGTTEEGEDYWLIKNSWGEGWGERGYLKLARNRNNLCGVATDTVYPVL